ncbi:MAG: type I DNA topoisomerase [Lentisphaerae bacterium]|jgi:DNA topoisomerase-1|nr:type I DNA topoisomerase [Lentisphaerota bacterium]
MGKKLLIVESPAKAKTIGKYLGEDFVVKSSVGHIRDLPKESGAIVIAPVGPDKWTFTPKYVVSDGKDKVVSELKSAVKSSDEIFLASDPDREGEAIAWHLHEVLAPVAGKKPFHRVTYNEITKSAVTKAVADPHDIDMPRVDAQQARRILDRIVGYKVSPLLWKNINCPNNRSLSAGRVQSVALRLLVERQREIDAFKPETYFLMGVEARKREGGATFVARLARLDGEKPNVREQLVVNNLLLDLSGAELSVEDIKAQPKKRHALPPFTTSTLQQAASSVLGFSPGKTMKLAQALYEQGHITYMRTDSVNISEQARAAAREFVEREYGAEFYPDTPNIFRSKADAQGAHEAIRPTNIGLVPAQAKMDAMELKLYDLIWRRFLASQMADARTTVRTVVLGALKPGLAHRYRFTASATDIDFEGFLKVMKLSLKAKRPDSDEDDEDTDEVASLPPLAVGETLDVARWLADEKQTKGPSHYSEASLIKALEENGVGRPSTYAATIETLKTREYAVNEKKKLIPLERGFLVCDWLVKKLEPLFNVGYTAKMEAELDKVEEQGEPMNDMLSEFYAKFLRAVAECAEPAPDKEKFLAVFAILDEVKEWKPAKKVGRRTYDDRAFVESVKEQMESGRPLSSRQLEFLVRMALGYSSQIPDVEARLKECGVTASSSPAAQKADDGIVRYCFEVLDRIGGMDGNPFLKSLRDQFEGGRGLSPKQLSILARNVGDNALSLPDCEEVRAKLAGYADGGFQDNVSDPTIPKILDLFKGVTEWRPATKKGKKVYDDKSFVESLVDQYSRRNSLSPRQLMALKRVAVAYRSAIPDFDAKAEGLGLKGVPSSSEKSAEVVEGAADSKSTPKRRSRKKAK